MIMEGIEDAIPVPVRDDDPAEAHTGMDQGTPGHRGDVSPNLNDFLGSQSLVEELARAHPHHQIRIPNPDNPEARLRNDTNERSNPLASEGNAANPSLGMAQSFTSSSRIEIPRQEGRHREGMCNLSFLTQRSPTLCYPCGLSFTIVLAIMKSAR
jgi:hypothetical protein